MSILCNVACRDPHSGAADLHDHGTLGYAWFSGGSCHHGLPEIWGVCFSGLDANDRPLLQLLLKDEDLLEAPDDCAFLHGLSMISYLPDAICLCLCNGSAVLHSLACSDRG